MRAHKCSNCSARIPADQTLCGYCEADAINRALQARGFKTRIVKRETLFDEGLAFILIFLGWLRRSASRVLRRGKR